MSEEPAARPDEARDASIPTSPAAAPAQPPMTGPAPEGLAASSAEHRAVTARMAATLGPEPEHWPDEGPVMVTYHGPSGAFVDGEVTLEVGAEPVEMDVARVRALRTYFPDHSFQVVGEPEKGKGRRGRSERDEK